MTVASTQVEGTSGTSSQPQRKSSPIFDAVDELGHIRDELVVVELAVLQDGSGDDAADSIAITIDRIAARVAAVRASLLADGGR